MLSSVKGNPRGKVGLRGNRRLQDISGIAIIVAFSLVLCFPILKGQVPVASETLSLWPPWSQLPHEPIRNSTTADSVLLYLSWNQFERSAIQDGEWPLWDPYSFAGAPFAANSQSQLYYPLTWLMWLLPIAAGIQLLTLVNVWLAGVGMYLLCRHWKLSFTAAVMSALAFAGSGMLQLALELPGVASPYGWLPWMLLALDKSMLERSSRWTALAALFCGLELVSGNLQWAIYCYFAAACWVMWRFGRVMVTDGIGHAIRLLVRAFLALSGGLTLAAVHLAPLLELMSLSNRGGTRVSSNSAPLTALLRLIMPEYFGTSVDSVGSPLVFNDLWYVGIGVLLVGVVGLALPGPRERWLWLGVALFAVLVTYGVGPFLYVRWLPGMSSLLPARIGYLFIFAVALLGGYGLDGWLRECRSSPRRAATTLAVTAMLFAGLMVAAGLAQGASSVSPALTSMRGEQIFRAWLVMAAGSLLLAGLLVAPQVMRRRSLWASYTLCVQPLCLGAIILLLVTDLLTLAPDYNSYVSPDSAMPQAPSVEWLTRNGDFSRVISLGVDDQPPTLVPNVQMLYGFQSVSGYDSLHTARYDQFWGAVDSSVRTSGSSTPYANVFVRPQAYSTTLASLLNIRYVTSASPLAEPVGLKQVYSGEMAIYEKATTGPRAFVVTRAEVLPRNEVLSHLTASDFDPSTTVLLEREEAPPDDVPRALAAPSEAGVRIVEYKRNRVTVLADAPAAGWLVLADQNYPGWKATVDGVPQRVYTADYLLRAVPLAAGEHQVVFSYVPTNFGATLMVSVTALAALLVVLLVGSIRDRARRRRLVVNLGQDSPAEATNDDG